MSGYGCYADTMPEYDGMTIQEFCDYCHDNGENIYVVEWGKITTLANARDHTLQLHNLWMGRFTKKED